MRSVLILAMCLASGGALAQTNQRLSQSCASLAQQVKSQGVVYLPSGWQGTQRYVRDQSFCDYGMQTKPAWVAASDNPQCFIGYTCHMTTDDGGGR